jgi:hypothetical protein
LEIENIQKINGKLLAISTSEDGTKLLGKMLVCPLDESNLNRKGIKEADLSESELKTLIGQPLVGKILKNQNNEYDFTGHNLKKYYEFNPETNKIEVKYTFDTVPIGYFTSSEIEDIEIDGINKRCIVANFEIWTRYEQVCKVVLERFNSDDIPLAISWEVNFGDSYLENEITWLKDIVFFGVAVLGKQVLGAYPNAQFIEVAELENSQEDKELVKALTEDIIEEISNANQITTSSSIIAEEDNNKLNKELEGGSTDMSENLKEIVKEVSSLTDNDIYRRVRSAINNIDNSKWYYISRIYPYEFRAIAYEWNQESEDDYIEFVYSVNSDETVSITSQKDVKMVFMPKAIVDTDLATKDAKISTLTTKLAEKESELSTSTEALVKAGEELTAKDVIISEKQATIAELTPLKEAKDAEIAQATAQKLEADREALKTFAQKGNYISAEELETSEELKAMIEALDQKSIKAEIASRVIAKLDEVKPETVKVEISEVSTDPVVKVNINNSVEKEDVSNAMKSFLNS